MSAPGPEHFYPLQRKPEKFAFFANKSPGPIWWPLVVAAAGVALASFFAGRATAAELPPPTWEIFVYVAGRDLREDRPTNRPLYDAPHRKTFGSFSECRDEILFVKVRKAGLRLRCDRTDR